MRDYSQEIKIFEQKYARIDEWAKTRKEKIAKKLARLKQLQAKTK